MGKDTGERVTVIGSGCDYYIDLLRMNGYEASKVNDAAALAESLPAAVVVCSSNGDEVHQIAKEVLAKESLANVPFLVIAEESVAGDWSSGLQGTVDVVTPPVGRNELLARIRLLLALRDGRQKIEELSNRLFEAQRMECVGSIASGVVHEFNNLMFVLLGFAEMAQGAPDDIATLRECADAAMLVAKRSSSVIGSFSAISKRVAATFDVGDVNEVVKDSVKLLKRYLDERRISVVTSLGDLPSAEFSHGQMQQVMINLIINAAQAMDERPMGRELTINTARGDATRILISVSDNGKGMSEECMERIFTPFFTTKKAFNGERVGGSGLGLSIVKEMVKRHSGVVHVDSKEGVGSVFTIYLPVYEGGDIPASAEAAGDNLISGARSPLKVLIVDDEQSNLSMIARILIKNGYEVYTESSVRNAMAHFWSGNLGLIILDLVMPDIDGAQCVSMLREDGIETPILVCTGVAGSPLIEKALSAGAQDVILKPFSARALLGAVEKCVSLSPK
jgi:two-component system, cell cycle sensor histidine kinase and response regulator CckA